MPQGPRPPLQCAGFAAGGPVRADLGQKAGERVRTVHAFSYTCHQDQSWDACPAIRTFVLRQFLLDRAEVGPLAYAAGSS